MKHEAHLTAYLRDLLGEESFVRFCQAFGGTRVYVPLKVKRGGDIVRAIGEEAARRLVDARAAEWIRVPLARRDRALFYYSRNMSQADIALKLGITENGVQKLLYREPELPTRQLKLL